MAKEVDLKKIELKVSVNCCDGCKIKVKKVLRSVEGVLKTEIDPLQPKVTVLGNIDPQILIKKLLKVGKQAEILSHGNQNSAGKEKKEAETVVSKEKEKEKSKCACEQAKCTASCSSSTTTEKSKASTKEDKASNKDQKEVDITAKSSNTEVNKNENNVPPTRPEVNFTMYPSMSPAPGNDRTYTQYCYKVEPCAITLPYCAIPSYSIPPPPQMYYGQEYYDRPPFQAPAAGVGDYFSEENTIGCNIM